MTATRGAPEQINLPPITYKGDRIVENEVRVVFSKNLVCFVSNYNYVNSLLLTINESKQNCP